jgi:hypothetical protein
MTIASAVLQLLHVEGWTDEHSEANWLLRSFIVNNPGTESNNFVLQYSTIFLS